MASYPGAAPFRCELCGMDFSNKDKYDEHERKVHAEGQHHDQQPREMPGEHDTHRQGGTSEGGTSEGGMGREGSGRH
jgi:hypothetical protein